MDIKQTFRNPGSQGNSAAEVSDIVARACSWAYGHGTNTNAIEAESREEDMAFGVPHEPMPTKDAVK